MFHHFLIPLANIALPLQNPTLIIIQILFSLLMNTFLKGNPLLLIILAFSGLMQAQVPEGYYNNAQNLAGDELRQTLHVIIRNHTRKSYDQLWSLFLLTDQKTNGKVWDIYSDRPLPSEPPYEFNFFDNQCAVSGQPEGTCYNREHSFPRSWWGGGTLESDTMYTDMFHTHPVDSWVNSHRSNYPYGLVEGPATTMNGGKRGANVFSFDGEVFEGTVFEPIDAYKGDLARNYFYMLTRYKSRISDWSGNTPMLGDDDFAPWAAAMLLQWHEQDPVSQKEVDRNNAIYNLQGNRNPFIDHPEFVNLIWGDGFEPEPENHVSDFSAHTITLTWADAEGPILPDGYLVRMSDKSFSDIPDPIDGQYISDDFYNQNVPYGKQSVRFGGLVPNTVYYFRIFSYTGVGEIIDYKTGSMIPEISIEAK